MEDGIEKYSDEKLLEEDNNILSDDILEEIKKAFDLFDVDGKGVINMKEIKSAIESLNYKEEEPIIYKLLEDLNDEKYTYNQFVEFFGKQLKGTKSMFNLFIDDQKNKTITLENLIEIAYELNVNLNIDELKDIFRRISANGTEIKYKEFEYILKKFKLI
jgi:Ca2+-binding EF-hand superfamily protein